MKINTRKAKALQHLGHFDDFVLQTPTGDLPLDLAGGPRSPIVQFYKILLKALAVGERFFRWMGKNRSAEKFEGSVRTDIWGSVVN